MAMEQDIVIISFYMRDATYERVCHKPFPTFIPSRYKFQDFDIMSDQIPGKIMNLR